MSLPAFYLEPEKWQPHPSLTGSELAHARVLRLTAGDRVQLLDGNGKIAIAELERFERQKLILNILEESCAPMPASRPIIALALSKAVRRGFFMEKASELGAWEIWLWHADFSQGKFGSQLADNLRGQLIAGMKQSRNPWLPRVSLLPDAASVASAAAQSEHRILPWEKIGGSPMLELSQIGLPGQTVYVIGPEGGFSETELETFKAADFDMVSLGDRVLRCETAASLCLGLHWWASQLPATH